LAIPEARLDELEFEEDHTVLGILCNKVFRRAIESDAEMTLPPDIEKEALAEVPDLTAAMTELDEAREGMTMVHLELEEWREELSVGEAS
jgi:hypothetical protein